MMQSFCAVKFFWHGTIAECSIREGNHDSTIPRPVIGQMPSLFCSHWLKLTAWSILELSWVVALSDREALTGIRSWKIDRKNWDLYLRHHTQSGSKLKIFCIFTHRNRQGSVQMRAFEPTNESEDRWCATHGYNFIIRVK